MMSDRIFSGLDSGLSSVSAFNRSNEVLSAVSSFSNDSNTACQEHSKGMLQCPSQIAAQVKVFADNRCRHLGMAPHLEII